jgi:ribonuclease/clavin/mitogillin
VISVERFGDVVRLRMSTAASRAVALDVSAYVVRGILVDTGFPRGRRILERALAATPVHAVAVTHWHEDHAGNVPAMAERGLPFLIHPETERILRAHPRIRLYRHVVWGSPQRLERPIVRVDRVALAPIHTPGHSPDHCAFWDADTATLFSGDLWLGVRARTMHAAEDPYVLVESVRRVAALNPARLFDAHRGPVERPTEALAAKADWLESTIAAIEAKVRAGWSDRAIRRVVLGRKDMSALFSGGEYSRLNLVRAVRRSTGIHDS